jgi:phage-related protein
MSLPDVDKYVNIPQMRNTRNISWIKAARRDFEDFPEDVQTDMLDALTVAAEGGKSEKAKPFKVVDGGVFEIALRYRSDAFRALYAVKIDGYLGNPRIPEEIEIRNQNPADGG